MTDKYIFLNSGYKFNSTGLSLDKIKYALKNYWSSSIQSITTFTDINNKEIPADSLIKTGDHLKVDVNNKPYGAQFIVLGDTTNDGKVQFGDVIKIYHYSKGSSESLW